MRTMWKGSISFGLVNVPVKMYAATEDKDVTFKYLHQECGTPVKNIRTCPNCEREIEWSEVTKGYEYQPGQFVLMDDEDFEKLAPEKNKRIDIVNFVDLEEIDPVYFNKSYYLAPEDTGNKAYSLLRTAMEETGKIALAKVIIRTSQTLAVLRTLENCIVMESIFYPEEVRPVAAVPGVPAAMEVDETEMKMARSLIESLAVAFEPDQYKNEYKERLVDAIQQKVQGDEVKTAAEPKRDQINDLMAALQASLNVTRGEPAARPIAVGETVVDEPEAAKAADEDDAPKPKRRRRKATE